MWAKLRYALHAMTFSYLSDTQRLWALYDCSMSAANINGRKRYSTQSFPLFVVLPLLSLSWCPGRPPSSLAMDLDLIAAAGVRALLLLATEGEYAFCLSFAPSSWVLLDELWNGFGVSISSFAALCAERSVSFQFFFVKVGDAPPRDALDWVKPDVHTLVRTKIFLFVF